MILIASSVFLLSSVALCDVTAARCAQIFSINFTETQIRQSIASISRLQLDVDLANARHDRSLHLATMKQDLIQRKNELVDLGVMTRDELNEQIRLEIPQLQKRLQKEDRDQIQDRERQLHETRNGKLVHTGAIIILQEILPGTVDVGDMRLFPTEVNRPYQLASTQTTQIVWRRIVERALQLYGRDFEKLPSNPSRFKGDLHPVESATYPEVLSWFMALNKLASDHDPIVEELFPGHKEGDIYRLPTQLEREFAARGFGSIPDYFTFGKDQNLLDQHAWYSGNSNGTTHPVATKEPFEIDDYIFYDLHGNVGEWIMGTHSDSNPMIVRSGYPYVGAGWKSDGFATRIGNQTNLSENSITSEVGFRIVRSRP